MTAKRIDLPERGTQEPQVGLFYIMQQELRGRTKSAAADLTPTQLAWKPDDGGNSAGELLLHIAEAEVWWIKQVCAGEALTTAEQDDYRTELYGDPSAPPLAEQPFEWFVDKLDETRRFTMVWYTTLSDLSLDNTRPYTAEDGKAYEFTIRWILFHLLEHEAGHRAQILSLRRIIKNRKIV